MPNLLCREAQYKQKQVQPYDIYEVYWGASWATEGWRPVSLTSSINNLWLLWKFHVDWRRRLFNSCCWLRYWRRCLRPHLLEVKGFRYPPTNRFLPLLSLCIHISGVWMSLLQLWCSLENWQKRCCRCIIVGIIESAAFWANLGLQKLVFYSYVQY